MDERSGPSSGSDGAESAAAATDPQHPADGAPPAIAPDETLSRRRARPSVGPAVRPLVIAVAALALVIDQITKQWAVRRLADGQIIEVVGSLRFRLEYNSGMAFSLGSGRGWLFGIVSLIVVVALIRASQSLAGWYQLVPVGLVVGGALGNVMDRIFRSGTGVLGGRVVDFVDLQWWPVFNVADSCIVVGALWLVAVLAVAPEPGSR